MPEDYPRRIGSRPGYEDSEDSDEAPPPKVCDVDMEDALANMSGLLRLKFTLIREDFGVLDAQPISSLLEEIAELYEEFDGPDAVIEFLNQASEPGLDVFLLHLSITLVEMVMAARGKSAEESNEPDGMGTDT
jgi:hypothetical protein